MKQAGYGTMATRRAAGKRLRIRLMARRERAFDIVDTAMKFSTLNWFARA